MSDTVKTTLITAIVSVVLAAISAYVTINQNSKEIADQTEKVNSLSAQINQASAAASKAESTIQDLVATVEAINRQLEGLDWRIAGLMNDFSNYGEGYAVVSYAKDRMGFVHLRGLAQGGGQGAAYPIFILPEGFRPEFHTEVTVGCSAEIPCELIINEQSGEAYFETWDSGWVSLDGVAFSSAP
jgi:hypothetical protein